MTDQPDRLAEIRQRRAAATRTPWHWDIEGGIWSKDAGRVGTFYLEREGQFVAHAPDDIDHLLERVERLRGLLGRLEWDANGYCTICDAPSPAQTGGDGHRPDCELAAVLRST